MSDANDRRVVERRTVAMRGPGVGAGVFTPPTSVAASNPCLNCGTNVQLEFCPECGQRAIDPDPTLREFLREFAEELLHWDGKLASTFRMLVTKPGALTEEYLAGKRVRYISPLRLYLACSVLYFFCAAIVPDSSLKVSVTVDGRAETAEGLAAIDSLSRATAATSGVVTSKLGRALRDRGALVAKVTAAIPTTMWVLLPIFAAIVATAFRDRRRHYPQHLVFALHMHAMLFLAMLILLIGRVTGSEMIGSVLTLLVGGGMGMYVLSAAHRVYGGAQSGVLARVSLVFITYGIAFVIAMLVTFGVIILSF